MAVEYRESVLVRAPVQRVWQVLADVEAWPGWTASTTAVTLLDGPPREGARVRIRQPRLPVTTWTVTDWRPGLGFTWTASGPGVRTTARHELVDGPVVRVDLVLVHDGPAAPVLHLLAGRLTRRYVRTEAEGLRARCEAPDR